MKKIFFIMLISISAHSFANIEYSSQEPAKATVTEIKRNRACFEELKVQGCGDPGEDAQHFRSCLNNSFELLSVDCKKMMLELYGTR